MNEQLQKSMAEILALLTESAKTVGATAQQEIPLLVQEYLRWGLWSSLLAMAVWLVVIAVVVVTVRAFWRISEGFDMDIDRSMSRGLVGAGAIILGAIAFVSVVDSAMTAVQVVIAPRVYLLENVIGAIK